MKLLGFGSNLQILHVLDKQINLFIKNLKKRKKKRKEKRADIVVFTVLKTGLDRPVRPVQPGTGS